MVSKTTTTTLQHFYFPDKCVSPRQEHPTLYRFGVCKTSLHGKKYYLSIIYLEGKGVNKEHIELISFTYVNRIRNRIPLKQFYRFARNVFPVGYKERILWQYPVAATYVYHARYSIPSRFID